MKANEETPTGAGVAKSGPVHRVRPALANALGAVLLMLAAVSAAVADGGYTDSRYRLGEGLRLAETGFSLGGYATARYDDLAQASPRIALDNLSLFVWWQGESRWKFFSEFDYENVFSAPDSDRTGEKRYLALERLYVDYALSDRLNLRAGKFLTPIGRWNLIHATPLVWTTSRPLVTTASFPTNATGLMLHGTLPQAADGAEYAVYASRGNELRPNPALDPFREAVGAHVTWPLTHDSQLGLSYAAFEQEQTRDERKRLAGLDFVWTRNRWELSAEGVYRFSDDGNARDEKGAFGQLVAPLGPKLYAVARYELFRQALAAHAARLWTAGVNYRITPAVVLKAEWNGNSRDMPDAPEGFMSSLSVLF